MDSNERTLTIEELKQAKEQLLNQMNEQNNNQMNNNQTQDNSNSRNNAMVKSLGSGSVTGGLNMYPVYDDKKTAFVNVLTLAILSFFFECLFLVISFMIFK